MIVARFTRDHRRELSGTIRLLPEQIADLETVALPTLCALLRRQPAKNDVREELQEALTALLGAERAIQRLHSGSVAQKSIAKEFPPVDAALARVIVASWDFGAEGDVLDNAMPPLSAAIRVIESAIKALPVGATRHKTASYYPIGLIDKALLSGFLKAHGPGLSGPNSGKALPPYLIEQSYRDGSDYRRIVEICYAAAGAGEESRERAIRGFMRARRRTEPPQET